MESEKETETENQFLTDFWKTERRWDMAGQDRGSHFLNRLQGDRYH